MITFQHDSRAALQEPRMTQTDMADFKLFSEVLLWLLALLKLGLSVLCLGGSCCSLPFPSLSLAEVKMSHWVSSWFPSSLISLAFHRRPAAIVTLWRHHFPLSFYGKTWLLTKDLPGWWSDFCSSVNLRFIRCLGRACVPDCKECLSLLEVRWKCRPRRSC